MQEFYLSLQKPIFAPPSFLFGPVWTILYLIIFFSFSYIIYSTIKKGKISKTIYLAIFINLLSNFLFTPLMFYFENIFLATIDIFIVLFSIIWIMALTYKEEKVFFYFQFPYLFWVSFASFLQVSILIMN